MVFREMTPAFINLFKLLVMLSRLNTRTDHHKICIYVRYRKEYSKATCTKPQIETGFYPNPLKKSLKRHT